MFRQLTLLFAVAVPALASADLLHYDLEFETYDSEHWVGGTGFLLADTELDAIVGARLESEEFIFSWATGEPLPLVKLDEYYDADVVTGGMADGINVLTGESAQLDLMFLLWPPAEDGLYADKLHNHVPEDVWSTIHLPSEYRPDEHWMNSPLETHFQLSAPVKVAFEGATGPISVAEPSTLVLLGLGGLFLGFRRRLA